ncbi:cathepsin D [Malassezia psittaci]|uniref:Cathepsin D n=1 Tax=Malassezia psittaci TaxID=1821823 RepID=A0AAF0JDJ5_9BASI|nr:cathepsin D [Malassezia psittaci]
MQITIPLLSLFLLATSNVFAGPVSGKHETGTPISLERRARFVSANGQVNLAALARHYKHIDTKYSKAMENYQKNTGHVHPLKAHRHKKRDHPGKTHGHGHPNRSRNKSSKSGGDPSSGGMGGGSGSDPFGGMGGGSGSDPFGGMGGGEGTGEEPCPWSTGGDDPSGGGMGGGTGSDGGMGGGGSSSSPKGTSGGGSSSSSPKSTSGGGDGGDGSGSGSGSGGGDSGDGTLELTDVGHEQLWAGEMTFGGQTFSIDFDTGSADTLVNPSAYDPSKSGSSQNTGQPFQTSYGDGTSAEGTIYTDSMTIGGFSADNVAIGVANNQFITDDQAPSQGISGMSFPSLQAFPQDYPPFFESLRKANAVNQGVFQFTLKPEQGAELHLGGIDQSKAQGDFSYAKVDSSMGFWVTDATINGQQIKAIVDSGSTIITGPTEQVESVVQTIQGVQPSNQGGSTAYMYDCDSDIEVDIEIAGLQVKLGKDQMRFGQNGGQCVLPIMGMDGMPMDAWILGDTLFMATTIVFDMDQEQMGFALQA